ncbi:MAG: DHH family phosphoesterase [Archaeoglobaceae archaeon]|nr:DHH family phosphoesterase [Archaeoglobaceae archaeon]MCX8152004.1 DHH family phosphoesterase [Archaeoglobaceae archaeon]MDW8013393.1 DHH family phosphoesterase [Archaeoglobaceae archaeon]
MFEQIYDKANKIAKEILKQKEVLVVTHIDADGITSGAIAYESLKRAEIDVEIEFVKQLGDDEVEKIKDRNKFTWFTDLGSGQIDKLKDLSFAITDHHVPISTHKMQLNPNDFGLDGTIELSGAGTTFLVASRLKKRRSIFDFFDTNLDLLKLAIVGAVGDLQDSVYCKLVGLNRKLLEKAVRNRIVEVVKDLRFFGKQTRPIVKMLEYNNDPVIPGISGEENNCLNLLKLLNIDPWKRWIETSFEEKRKIISELVKICINYGMHPEKIYRLVGECYILLDEVEGTEKRDAMEFSTLLNATARYGQEEVGLRVCLGEDEAFRKARNLLQNHRKVLSSGLKLVEEIGVEELENIQFFHAEDEIPDTVVGIVAGIVLNKINQEKPIVAFARSDKGVKVSARANKKLLDLGLNLAEAIKIAAEKVGGSGGGHKIAAGATIPEGKEEAFLIILNEIIAEQLKVGK